MKHRIFMKKKKDAPKEKANCIKKSLKNSGQDKLIFIFPARNKEMKVLNKLVNNNTVLKHCYLRCRYCSKTSHKRY